MVGLDSPTYMRPLLVAFSSCVVCAHTTQDENGAYFVALRVSETSNTSFKLSSPRNAGFQTLTRLSDRDRPLSMLLPIDHLIGMYLPIFGFFSLPAFSISMMMNPEDAQMITYIQSLG